MADLQEKVVEQIAKDLNKYGYLNPINANRDVKYSIGYLAGAYLDPTELLPTESKRKRKKKSAPKKKKIGGKKTTNKKIGGKKTTNKLRKNETKKASKNTKVKSQVKNQKKNDKKSFSKTNNIKEEKEIDKMESSCPLFK